ncbi:MAG: ATP-binding protein [Gemmataceae bacterium]
MARPWRLRHKLLLGLALVGGILATLLASIVHSQSSYLATMKTADSKLTELQKVEELRDKVAQLLPAEKSGTPPRDELTQLRQNLAVAQATLAEYEALLQETIQKGRDPDGGYQENHLIEDFKKGFTDFDTAIDGASGFAQIDGQSQPLTQDERIKAAHAKLVRAAKDLRKAIYDDMYLRIDIAKRNHLNTMIIVFTCSAAAVLLLGGLLYFFYGWIFYPIKRLQDGVQQVAQGHFDQPIRLNTGDELEEFAHAFNDMSARVQATWSDLARQVNERSRQLVRSERLVSVGFLAAGVAHEINNPLASIAFCAEGLQRRLADTLRRFPQDSETVQKYLGMIHTEAFRCKEITQKLLEFSRVGERRREPAELVELVQAVLEIAQLLQNCRGKSIVFQPQQRIAALVNGPDVKSVVLNLVVNALDSMEEGGTLTITVQQHGPAAELTFADTGCGMEPDVLENIFEPFFTRSRTGKGTGLGLFISHQIVSQHDGQIEAHSDGPGRGSTFTVRFPLQPAQEARAA